MNTSELKVGDRVKMDYCNKIQYGKITSLPCAGDSINFNIHHDNESICRPVDPRWIVSKLEPVYQEIIIEKEITNTNQYQVVYKCKICKVLNFNLNKPDLICDECKQKQNNSFKFDISYVNRVEFEYFPHHLGMQPASFFRIDGYKITYYPDNPQLDFNTGKTYTIEIKEKAISKDGL